MKVGYTIIAGWCLMTVICSTHARKSSERPHIIVLLADDLGWNDVSWHNSNIKTPRMEELARDGVRLEKSYVHAKCSPSRAALMTGRYAWRLGRQRSGLGKYQPTGLNTNIKILPEYLQDGGYSTHMVGKWHLGYCNSSFLPTSRGFKTFFGQYTHITDYYTRKVPNKDNNEDKIGFDLRDNKQATMEGNGEFTDELYTRKAVEIIEAHDDSTPLFLYVAFQAPHGPIPTPPRKYRNLYKNKHKKLGARLSQNMASTITALDYAVGDIYDALKKSGLYQNSVIIFSTDNGGSVQASSNLPLKGNKEELYEGGVRGVGFVNSPLLDNSNGKHNKLMFITDWFATILSLAGQSGQIPQDTDSYNMWPSLVSDQVESPRTQIILNIDQNNSMEQWSAAVIDNSWKFIWGQSYLLRQQLFLRYCRSWNTSAAILENISDCNVELYNLREDPEEKNNLAAGGRRKERVNFMKEIIINQLDRFVPADEPEDNSAGFPVNFGGFISTGWCNI